ncbi:MAG: hypothetical protein PHF86_13285 [Candidatus Nanoarchaeia archaeon]|nr:hypothetical protein [Candidatus Nanoarchaeia archaeon]
MKNVMIQVGIVFLVCYIIQIFGVLIALFDGSSLEDKKHFFFWCIPFIPFLVLIYKKIKDLD